MAAASTAVFIAVIAAATLAVVVFAAFSQMLRPVAVGCCDERHIFNEAAAAPS